MGPFERRSEIIRRHRLGKENSQPPFLTKSWILTRFPQKETSPPQKKVPISFYAMSVTSGQKFWGEFASTLGFCLHYKRNKKRKTEGFYTEMNYLTREC